MKDYGKRHPDKIQKHRKNVWKSKKREIGCSICGFKRFVELCHIKWEKDGGKVNKANITILCPNHHRLFDHNLLTAEELSKIKTVNNL
jgi:predicted restriction endonuclease